MLNIEFTPEEIDALEHERYYHFDPKVQRGWRFSISKAVS